jgi:hypothetical protein
MTGALSFFKQEETDNLEVQKPNPDKPGERNNTPTHANCR